MDVDKIVKWIFFILTTLFGVISIVENELLQSSVYICICLLCYLVSLNFKDLTSESRVEDNDEAAVLKLTSFSAGSEGGNQHDKK